MQRLLGAIRLSKTMNGGDGSMATTIAPGFSVMYRQELAELQRMVSDSTVVRGQRM
ncbi:hypothetical protein [Pantoea agglomerans]|uniref:hypothetical protein n=1 Tax=Enterobacter agglomerans TaxID=549 RepID=UPI00045C4784|nr:hypothetical protein [Pantoea agglomerans]KDA94323.1 hypothetical protein T296_11890 [Pantoea agglomerans Eh318]